MAYYESPAHLSRPGQELAATGTDATVNPLHIEQYGGQVESQFVKSSIMREFVSVKSVVGTDTITNDRIGSTSLQRVAPGVRPTAAVAQFDNVNLRVDTLILARNNVWVLDDFQAHYNVRAELGKDHGKIIGRFFDEALIIQTIKSANIVAAADPQNPVAGETALPPGWHGGTRVDLDAVGDEEDPAKLQRAIEDVIQGIEEKDVDLDGGVILVRPAEYYTLLRNDKLISAEYSTGNGDYAQGMVLRSAGLPIKKTNRIPDEAITGHYLSNSGNGNAYDVSAEEARTVAVVMLPKAVLAGETIPLTSDVFYEKSELQWFIDSYIAFGATPNRAEHAGIVVAADPAP